MKREELEKNLRIYKDFLYDYKKEIIEMDLEDVEKILEQKDYEKLLKLNYGSYFTRNKFVENISCGKFDDFYKRIEEIKKQIPLNCLSSIDTTGIDSKGNKLLQVEWTEFKLRNFNFLIKDTICSNFAQLGIDSLYYNDNNSDEYELIIKNSK